MRSGRQPFLIGIGVKHKLTPVYHYLAWSQIRVRTGSPIENSPPLLETERAIDGDVLGDPTYAPSWHDIQTLPLNSVAEILDVDPDTIREHSLAGRRSSAFNLPGKVALKNLRAHIASVRASMSSTNPNAKPVSLPHQQVSFIDSVVNEYPAHPQILPRIRTSCGRYPSKPMRSMISAVLVSVISLTDFDTFRICFTSDKSLNNRFSDRGPLDMGLAPLSLKAVAKRAGFTYWRKGVEVVDRKFRRAYDLIRKSGYIFSHQQLKRNRSTFSGFDMAMRWVSPALFNDIRKALPYLVSEDQWAALRKHAKKRAAKTRKLFSVKDLPSIDTGNTMVQSLRRRLSDAGFNHEFLRELIVRFVHGSPGPSTTGA